MRCSIFAETVLKYRAKVSCDVACRRGNIARDRTRSQFCGTKKGNAFRKLLEEIGLPCTNLTEPCLPEPFRTKDQLGFEIGMALRYFAPKARIIASRPNCTQYQRTCGVTRLCRRRASPIQIPCDVPPKVFGCALSIRVPSRHINWIETENTDRSAHMRHEVL